MGDACRSKFTIHEIVVIYLLHVLVHIFKTTLLLVHEVFGYTAWIFLQIMGFFINITICLLKMSFGKYIEWHSSKQRIYKLFLI